VQFLEQSIEVAFSPNGASTVAMVSVIDQTERSVHLAGYSFTSRPIATALIAAEKRGPVATAVGRKPALHRRPTLIWAMPSARVLRGFRTAHPLRGHFARDRKQTDSRTHNHHSRRLPALADTTLTLPGLRAKPSRYPAFTARCCTRREPAGKARKSESRVG